MFTKKPMFKKKIIDLIETGSIEGLEQFSNEEIVSVGLSPLYITAELGKLDFLRHYHDKIKPLDDTANFADYAAKGGNLETFKFLFSLCSSMTGSGVDWLVEFGKTKNHYEILKIYYKQGFKLHNYRNLTYPVANGNLEILKFLVQSGVALSKNVFKEALEVEDKNVRILKYLVTLAIGPFQHFKKQLEDALKTMNSPLSPRISLGDSLNLNRENQSSLEKFPSKAIVRSRKHISRNPFSSAKFFDGNTPFSKVNFISSDKEEAVQEIAESPTLKGLIPKTPKKQNCYEILKPSDLTSTRGKQLVSTLQKLSPKLDKSITAQQQIQELELSSPNLTSLESLHSNPSANEGSQDLTPADCLNLMPIPMNSLMSCSNSSIVKPLTPVNISLKSASLTSQEFYLCRPHFTPKRSPLSNVTRFSSPEDVRVEDKDKSPGVSSGEEELTDDKEDMDIVVHHKNDCPGIDVFVSQRDSEDSLDLAVDAKKSVLKRMQSDTLETGAITKAELDDGNIEINNKHPGRDRNQIWKHKKLILSFDD